MSEPDAIAAPPEPEIKRGRRVSVVWIIPAVALLIGGGLGFKTWSEAGPDVTIVFDSATGLEAGKTPVKYKDVVVGTIASVTLDPRSREVVAVAGIRKSAEPFVTDTARFWVVRPRLAVTEISGLGTLVTGAYVELDPGAGGTAQRRFTALDEPPVVRGDTPGVEIVLVADDLGSLTRGAPVYFRGIDAGEVLGYELAEDKRQVFIHAFVHAPYDRLLRDTSRFWNISGFDFAVGADGVKIGTGTLQSLVLGGVAFETPDQLAQGEPVASGARFALFASRADVSAARTVERARFVLNFTSSVRGLSVGAPVEFRGIRVGSVLDVRLEFDPRTGDSFIPVLIEIELDRVSLLDHSVFGASVPLAERQKHLDRIVARGLRARLKAGNFLTGQLFVDFDILPDTPVNLARRGAGTLEIPTLPQQIDEIANSLTELVAKLQRLPLDTVSQKLVSTLDGVDKLVHSDEIKVALASLKNASEKLQSVLVRADTVVVPGAARALDQADGTLKAARQAMASADTVLKSLDSVVSEQSSFRYETTVAIQEIAAAARSIRELAETLQRNPSALLTGKAPK